MASAEEDERWMIGAVSQEDDRVLVDWQDGHRSSFHAVWLRHARSVPACGGRADAAGEFLAERPGEVAAKALEVTAGGRLRVTWSRGAEASEFDARWLRAHCTSARERARRRRPVRRWDGALAERLARISYARARSGGEGRLALYRLVLDYGFALVEGVPAEPGRVAEAGGLFGLVRPSPYADDPGRLQVEDVRHDPRVRVATRLSNFLAPHTDTCWRTALSGLVLLHCLAAQEDGGESILVDGFEAAARLRKSDPEAFALLSEVRLNFAASVNNGDEWRAPGRVITCDEAGEVVGIRFNRRSLQPLDLPEDLIEPAYGAIAGLEAILYDQRLWLRRRLEPGELLVLDNQRVLHGRSAFDPEAGARHLQTCAVERDLFHNNYRRLARSLGRDDWDQTLASGAC